jgi:hypothetical protein
MSKNLSIALVAILILGAGAWWFSNGRTIGSVTILGNGLSQYQRDDWGLSFRYPSSWTLTEEKSGARAAVQGEGYSVRFIANDYEYPGGVHTITRNYTVAGQQVKALEDKYQSGFMQGLPACNGVSIDVTSPVASKAITDKIIASVDCTKK